jgi:hypothetical protein
MTEPTGVEAASELHVLGGRYGTRTHDLCRVKAIQRESLTSIDARKWPLTCDFAIRQFSAFVAVF